MPRLVRELDRKATGPALNDEDWWRLVFDTDTKRLQVEHEWHHVNARGKTDEGKTEKDVFAFLSESGQKNAHRELERLLTSLFTDKS